MSRFYTGVGSRAIPRESYDGLVEFAERLVVRKFVVRTGDAFGCDMMFAKTDPNAVVYSPKHVLNNPKHWSYREANKYIPNDRPDYSAWKPYVRALIARNMMQVLGTNGDDPSEFLLCYAPSTNYQDSSAGGTGYAVRCALAHTIPVYNVYSQLDRELFERFLKTL